LNHNFVSQECDHCGCETFVVYYDDESGVYHVECDGCGATFGVFRATT
jgi:hypothetical protein